MTYKRGASLHPLQRIQQLEADNAELKHELKQLRQDPTAGVITAEAKVILRVLRGLSTESPEVKGRRLMEATREADAWVDPRTRKGAVQA